MTFPDPYNESYPPSLWETEVIPTAAAAPDPDPFPNDTWTKAAIVDWLIAAGDLPADTNPETAVNTHTKTELLDLVGTGATPEPEPEPESDADDGTEP